MRRADWLWGGLAALALAGPACAQERSALGQFESWVTVEDEFALAPPWLRSSVGLLAWIETRTSLKIGGTELDDLETNQGLDSGGAGAWIELTIGQKIRGGVDGTYIKRLGDRAEQEEQLVIDGDLVGNVGDDVKTTSSFFTVGLLLEWDVLYGKTYRIGLLGGVRYFKTSTTIRGFLPGDVVRKTSGGELISPFFGGQVMLTPFPMFSVLTRIQFMNWSWHSVGLKEARFFEFRLGAIFHLIPEVLSLSLEYRFMAIQAEANGSDDGALSANGLVVAVSFSF